MMLAIVYGIVKNGSILELDIPKWLKGIFRHTGILFRHDKEHDTGQRSRIVYLHFSLRQRQLGVCDAGIDDGLRISCA